jgi:GNAT superfamily N-acetyltransferase
VEVRVATESDLEPVTELLTAAFASDPVWGWAFPDPADLMAWWRFNIRSALRFPWVWVLGDFAAASMWIPPGESELTEEEEARVESIVDELAGPRAGEILELLDRFETSHPADGTPHYYLSLLGTDPARRGHGHGMALLELNLALIDEERMPAYLESSNPGNDARYERRGFRRVGGFKRPDEQSTVATMWRAGLSGNQGAHWEGAE